MSNHSKGEKFSAITHTVGLCLVPCIAWVIIWLGYSKNWEMAFGATFFTVGMLLMYLASCFYHWSRPDASNKRSLRILDHCSVYLLIASSYTPICMGLIEDDHFVAGWTAFGIIWILILENMKRPRASMRIFPSMRFCRSLCIILLMQVM